MDRRRLRRALIATAAVCSAVALLTAAVNWSFAWLVTATVITLGTYAAAIADYELNRGDRHGDGRQVPLSPNPYAPTGHEADERDGFTVVRDDEDWLPERYRNRHDDGI